MSENVRRDPRPKRTYAALIAAGRRLYSERPVDAVTVDDIVQAADVGKGSFYNHFADRDALVQAIYDEIRTNVEQAIDQANSDVADPARRLTRANCIYLRFAIEVAIRADEVHGNAAAQIGLVGQLSIPRHH